MASPKILSLEITQIKLGYLLTYSYLCPQMNKEVLKSIRELLAQTLPPVTTGTGTCHTDEQ